MRSVTPLLFASLLTVACGAPAPAAEGPAPPSPSQAQAPPTATSAPSAAERSECPTGMRLVDGGRLRLGSPEGQGEANEHPQREVHLRPFCVDEVLVNLGAYAPCVENAICDAAPETVLTERPLSITENERESALCTARFAKNLKGGDDLPVNCVSHRDAERFCKWRGARLLTEAEFEWLASGGEDRLKFPWGNSEPDEGRLCWQQEGGPCSVKAHPPQALGVHDIVGNLAEWTSTPHAPYGDPDSPGEAVSVRGGSWRSREAGEVRAKRRDARPPIHREADLGFRCARDK
ncbi:MAG: SUMF1/EgtB/PvdO family nonheme iron enzyme [Polyangiaceae bacterium]|nr:SUMF1/EgtB/PvdO family nonheme iron enzyme [Polyangiaceae bacterium]MCW5792288.1 SUMF1/EgtB/PvdO family nonheme iron enzyme [Polyangiaceae bacterium]